MNYHNAKKLHNEDEVCIKGTNTVLTVVSIEVLPKKVIVLCDDGNRYTHNEIK